MASIFTGDINRIEGSSIHSKPLPEKVLWDSAIVVVYLKTQSVRK